MPKVKQKAKVQRKSKPKREKRDFSQIALSVAEQATGAKLKRR
jgi:hypothetical protein